MDDRRGDQPRGLERSLLPGDGMNGAACGGWRAARAAADTSPISSSKKDQNSIQDGVRHLD